MQGGAPFGKSTGSDGGLDAETARRPDRADAEMARRHGILGLIAINGAPGHRAGSEMARRHGILGLIAISARRATGPNLKWRAGTEYWA